MERVAKSAPVATVGPVTRHPTCATGEPGSSSPASTLTDAPPDLSPLALRAGSATMKGRFHANEDRCTTVTDLGVGSPHVALILMCDGHDGSACASMVATAFPSLLRQRLTASESPDVSASLAATFRDVEQHWVANVRAARGRAAGASSGSCVTAVVVEGSHVTAANVGDCRAILRRPDGTIQVLTADHRVSNDSERLRIMAAGGVIRNNRVCGVLEPTRTIGDLDEKAMCPPGVISVEPNVVDTVVDAAALLPILVPAKAATTAGGRALSRRVAPPSLAEAAPIASASRACFIIVATDGVWDVVSSKAAASIVAHALATNGGDSASAAQALINFAARCGSLDDITATVVTLHHAEI